MSVLEVIFLKNGYLRVCVFGVDVSNPLEGAVVSIVSVDGVHKTDFSGCSGNIVLNTAPLENSFDSSSDYVCEKYDIVVECEGFSKIFINGIEIFEGIISTQEVFMHPLEDNIHEVINIDPIVLSSDYSSKYNESFEKNFSPFVLNDVIIPEYIIVHDGYPSDYLASKYNVLFADYIKNVASSEVYPTWNKEALKANVLAIISFTLNRVYTEWYISKGYAFTITSVTAYDQKYTVNKAIFDSISDVVDEVLPQFIKRKDKDEPMFAQYCDGESTQNEGWLYQWGSNDLASRGYTYYKILAYYYGDNLEIKEANYQSGLPTSFPGYNLSLNSCGEDVKLFQEQLNIIRGNYPGLIKIENPNGEFDENTRDSIKFFQQTFNLSVTGIVDYSTWYKISYLYTAVKRMIFGVYDR